MGAHSPDARAGWMGMLAGNTELGQPVGGAFSVHGRATRAACCMRIILHTGSVERWLIER